MSNTARSPGRASSAEWATNNQAGRQNPLELEAKDVWVEVQGPLQGEAPGLAGQQLQGRGRGCAGAHRSARHQSVQRVLRYGR